jgi:putative hydrolase
MVNDIPFGFGLPDPDDQDKPSGAPSDPFGGLLGGAGGADLGAALQRFGQLLSTSSGPVHWQLAQDTARQLVASAGDPSVSTIERAQVTEAVEIAEVWLDDATALPSTGATPHAWSRAEWIEGTLPRWKSLVAPLAERMAQASAEALPTQMPEEMRAMAAPLMGMMGQMSGVMFGGQVGQGLGALAQEVLTSTDVGVPLAHSGVVALVPRNVTEFGSGLGVPEDQVRIYLALRECAHVRLFQHAPWLALRIESALADYARGISVDMAGIERALGGVDPSQPDAMAELMSSGVFEPPTTPEQQAALERLEHLLALVEGWVDDVTTAAADTRLPAAGALGESMRRRRATGGPAEHTFETLVGLHLRPRRLREASALWRALVEHGSIAERDNLWSHPDLLPEAADLDDPTAFATGTGTQDWDISTLTDAEPPDSQPPDDESPTTA